MASGKTTLALKIRAAVGKMATVKDLDDLAHDYIASGRKFTRKDYQDFIDAFIAEQHSNVIVFAGLNQTPPYVHNDPQHYYKLGADVRYYIKVPASTLLRRLYEREFNDFVNGFSEYLRRNKRKIYLGISRNERAAMKVIADAMRLLHFGEIKRAILRWDRRYRSEGYLFKKADAIYRSVVSLCESML